MTDQTRAAERIRSLLERMRARAEVGGGWVLHSDEIQAIVILIDAAQRVRASDQTRGNDWWEAHAKLYAALVPFVGNQP
jgi:hypothetical protein